MEQQLDQTVVGVFQSRGDAEAARNELIDADFPHRQVTLSEKAEEPGFWASLKELFTGEEEGYYTEAARRGHTVVTVNTSADRVEHAADIMERHNCIDLEKQAQQWRQEGWKPAAAAGAGAGAAAEGESIPLAEEQLKVGKRRERGRGVRVYTRVRETPVEEQVELTEERVHVERTPVDRPAGEEAFRERSVEATEFHEEPVVSKEARVTEEVKLSKEEEVHPETIRETVRKTEAEVEPIDENEVRREYERFAGAGGGSGSFEEYRPAYAFGRELAVDRRFGGKDFDTIEPEARQAFESRQPGGWERYRNAVRSGYERYRGAAR